MSTNNITDAERGALYIAVQEPTIIALTQNTKDLLDQLVQREWLVKKGRNYHITDAGRSVARQLGIGGAAS